MRSGALELYSVIPNHFIRLKLISMVLASDVSATTQFVNFASKTPNLPSPATDAPGFSFTLPGWMHGLEGRLPFVGQGRAQPVADQPGDAGQHLDFPARVQDDSAFRSGGRPGSKGIRIPRVPNKALHGGDTS